MPAQIYLTKAQLVAMAELEDNDGGVVVTEGPGAAAAQAIDVWVMDEESLSTNTHRSVVLDPEGEILGDQRLEDH